MVGRGPAAQRAKAWLPSAVGNLIRSGASRRLSAGGKQWWSGLCNDLAGFLTTLRYRPDRPGLYDYRVAPAGGRRRLQLRIHTDGSGLLLVDATDAIHLNQTAAAMARLALDDVPPRVARAVISRHFAADVELEGEVARIYALVEHLRTTADACPTCRLPGRQRADLFSLPPQAPYKADLALSYGCNNACRHCYNEADRRRTPSLDTPRWREIMARLARLGVPYVVFTGGEPTLVADLPELVAEADRLGMVCGMNTNGRRLADESFARRLVRAGLSHAQITLLSSRAEVHDAMAGCRSFAETVAGIRSALAAGLHTLTNTTLTRRNAEQAENLVDFLHHLGLRTFAANGMIYSGGGCREDDALAEDQLGPVVVRLRDRAAELGMRFLWYTPTAWCRLSPEELEVGPRRCNAAEYSICIEPNGDVLPCQSYYVSPGNILRDPWERIWHSALFERFRGRETDPRGSGLPETCWNCPDLSACGGGCPLERQRSPHPIAVSSKGEHTWISSDC
jgi:radical SAM protein with 4Fe4S-binding SPASM domain